MNYIGGRIEKGEQLQGLCWRGIDIYERAASANMKKCSGIVCDRNMSALMCGARATTNSEERRDDMRMLR